MVVMQWTTTAEVEPEHVAAYLDDGWMIVEPKPIESSFSERP